MQLVEEQRGRVTSQSKKKKITTVHTNPAPPTSLSKILPNAKFPEKHSVFQRNLIPAPRQTTRVQADILALELFPAAKNSCAPAAQQLVFPAPDGEKCLPRKTNVAEFMKLYYRRDAAAYCRRLPIYTYGHGVAILSTHPCCFLGKM